MNLFGSSTPATISDASSALRQLISSVQGAATSFLQQKSRLLNLQTRISPLSQLPQTSSASVTLQARDQALLNDDDMIQRDSMRYIEDANNLLNTLQTDPFWQQLSRGVGGVPVDISQLGYAGAQKIQSMIDSINQTAANLGQTLKNMQQHIVNCDQLEADIVSEEGYVQGRGFLNTATADIGSILSGASSTIKGPLMMIGIAAGIYFVFMLPKRRGA